MFITKVMVSNKIISLFRGLVAYYLHVRDKGLASILKMTSRTTGPCVFNRVYDFIIERFEQKTRRLQKSVKVGYERSSLMTLTISSKFFLQKIPFFDARLKLLHVCKTKENESGS